MEMRSSLKARAGSRPPARTIQVRYAEAFRILRAEYCGMRAAARTVKGAMRKATRAGKLGQAVPRIETVLAWSRGGLAVPDCWNSELPWAHVAALVDSKTIRMEEVLHGTELIESVRGLIAESLLDPVARQKLIRNPALLEKLARRMVGDAPAVALPELLKPVAKEVPRERRIEDLTDEELREGLQLECEEANADSSNSTGQ